MKMKFDEAMTKRIVENHYKQYYDLDGSLDIKCYVESYGPFGRSVVPIRIPKLIFTLNGNLTIDGTVEPVSWVIDNEDVGDCFITKLESQGHQVKNIQFDCDTSSGKNVGIFNEVVVDVSTKKKSKKHK